MGDNNRHVLFAEWIQQNFNKRKIKSCLVVADGKGFLAKELSKYFKVRVVEMKPRQAVRRKKLKYEKGIFDGNTAIVNEDLIVAMHPDEATVEVIYAANRNKKPFAIVPCCIMAKGFETHGVRGFRGWVQKLKELAHGADEAYLKMGGKNLVLWKK